MFHLYTEKARRAVFFARYEASQFGSPYIETEHLLLGVLREDRITLSRLCKQSELDASIRTEIEEATPKREGISTSVDLPLSEECKRVLSFAAEEAEQLQSPNIGTEHLLLGLLREEKSFAAALLTKRSVQLEAIRKSVSEPPPASTTPSGFQPNVSPVAVFIGVDGKRIGQIVEWQKSLLPGVGETVICAEQKYRVESVDYEYDKLPVPRGTADFRLSKILITLAPQDT